MLSHRLKLLEAHDIVSRRLYSDHPPRAEYTLTDRGRELRTVVRALGIWGSRHLDATWTFVHDACGANVEIAYYCPTCDETVAADQVRREASPARRRPRPRAGSRPAAARRFGAAKRASRG